jgi:hypothetical protein
MSDVLLWIADFAAGLGLIPCSVKFFGYASKLNDQVAGKVFRLDLASLFTPQADERFLIVSHKGPCVRAANKVAPFRVRQRQCRIHLGSLHLAFGSVRHQHQMLILAKST